MDKRGRPHTEVKLIDYMGSDKRVVDSARVIFNFEKKTWDDTRDTKLIRYLAQHKHWSPFSHCFATFKIKAPVFVARQLMKHQVGLSWNEVSRRYVDSEVEFYHPSIWRGRPVNKKQGSGNALKESPVLDQIYEDTIRHARSSYRRLIEQGVAPEQARAVLPLSMMTEWFWSGSLYAFSRVCSLRLADDAQQETRFVAGHMNQFMSVTFPVSWKELRNAENSSD